MPTPTMILAQSSPPARGTPLTDLVPATIVALVAVAGLAALAVAHRQGRVRFLDGLGERGERWSGLPGWAAQPIAVATVSLLVAVFGFYWDVSWHIDRGRDPGPFANPAHFFIIAGLAGIALAGVLSLIIGTGERTPTSVQLRPGWHVPVGGILLSLCGVIALAGFPLDDIWHRLFGQDVTLWGPTHLQMIGGASLSTLAMWVLLEEGRRARRRTGSVRWLANMAGRGGDIYLGGAFLIGLSTFQGEFDFGVPQFRQLFHPVLIMLAASIALVAVRIRFGRGGAIGAVLFFIAIRGALTLMIGPGLGRSTLHFPLYLGEALVVEAVALRVPRHRQLTFGLWAGLGIGTVGLAAEWAWSHVWMPLPWHASLLPEALMLAPLAAVAGGFLGGLTGRALLPAGQPRQQLPKLVGGVAWVAAVACLAYPAPIGAASNVTADVSLAQTGAGSQLLVRPTVQLDPPTAADHANWFNVTTWQGRRSGDGGLLIAQLHHIAPGRYTINRPIPAYGTWKALIRLHRGHDLEVVPVYLPADPAIPAAGVGPTLHFKAHFLPDKKVLQREAVGGSISLQRVAYGLALAVAVGWVLSLAWGLRRLDSREPRAARRRVTPVTAAAATS